MNTNTKNTASEAVNDPYYVMPERNHFGEMQKFFRDFKNSQIGTSFLTGIGNNAYTGLNPAEQKEFLRNYCDHLEDNFIWAKNGVENTTETEAERNLFTTNANAIRAIIGAAQTEIKTSRNNLYRRIRNHYPHPSTNGQPTLDNTALTTKIATLSLGEIKQMNQSLVKFSNYIKKIHSDAGHGIFNTTPDRKKKVEALANILGIAITDPKISDIMITLENNEHILPEKLIEVIGRISTLSAVQREELFVELMPELSLSEYLHIYETVSGKKPPKGEQILTNMINAMIARDYATGSVDEKEKIRKQVWVSIFQGDAAITISSRDFFNGTIIRTTEVNLLLDRCINDAIGTIDDDKKISVTIKKWNKEYLKEREDSDDTQVLDHENEQAAYDQELLKYNTNVISSAAFIAKLGELKIHNSEKLINVSDTNPLWLVYFSGGRPMYIEIQKIYHATDGKLTIDYISHLSTQGEYIENSEIESDDARAILHHIYLAESPSQERRQQAGLDKTMPKESKGVIMDRRGLEDRKQKGDIDARKRDESLTAEELNDRLYELDRTRNAIEPGLIIQARAIGSDDRYAYLQIKDITKKVTGEITEIELYTSFGVHGGQHPIKLSIVNFISAFSKSHAKRVGNANTTQSADTKGVNGLISIFKNTANQFPNEIKDMVFEPTADGKGKLTYTKGSISFPTNHIKTPGNPADYVYIEKINDGGISFYYGKNGNKTTQKKKTKSGETSESDVKFEKVHKFDNANLGFFLQFMHSFPGKTWSAGKDEEEANKLKEHLDEHKDKHGEHEHMHYHGGPLQWLAHSKNFGHFFKGMGMAFDKIKHYIEHGDEHTAKQMEYKILSRMHESKWLKKLAPTEVYLDMKAEIEAESFKAIEGCRDKWSKLSTGNLGSMAVALLEDKYTTNEQMFGLIFALYGKVGGLYGIPVLQNKKDRYGRIFFDKLCVINKVTEKEKAEVIEQAKAAFKAEGTIGEITEEFYIQVLSHRHLQKNINPPPVPGSFHAKLAAALNEGQKKQKESGLNGESNIYATTDQIEERMYMLLADGEVHQAIGFFERLIARGASAQQLMTLPFVLATTDARKYLSTGFIRDSLIEAFYKQGLPFGILNTLTNQDKYNNFQELLKELSSETNRLTGPDGEAILQEEAAKDLRAIFNAKDSKIQDLKGKPTSKDKQASGGYDTKLKNQTECAKEFWKKHGDTMARILNVTDEKSILLTSNNDKTKKYLKDAGDAINGDHFNINIDQAKNGTYNEDVASFALIAPKEAVNSFKPNNITGVFSQDDNGEMHRKIFDGFIRAFGRVKNIKNNDIRKKKFGEMHFILLKKFGETLGEQAWNEIIKSQPPWYRDMKSLTGIDFSDARYSKKAINGFIDANDERYQKLFSEGYARLIGNTPQDQSQSEKIIQGVRNNIYKHAPANDGNYNQQHSA